MQLTNEIACCIANCIRIYNYPLIASFDIFCQQEINWIYSLFHKAEQVPCDRGTRKAIFQSVTVYNKNIFSQCNLTAQIESVQDKFN